jgi:DNA invertase Pin-like site-specific DNA recombinase
MTDQKRAAGYVRVSTTGQVEGESLATQRERIATFCRAHGYELTRIYADEGVSGASTKKPSEFLRLLEDAKAGLFHRQVVCDLSRFGRNLKELLDNYDRLEASNIKLVFLKESVDTSTPHGRLFRNLLASFAEYEREVIRVRMLGNRTARWKRGGAFVGKVPFGYTWNKERKRVEVNSQEAETYRRIVAMYVNEGMSYLDVALRLKREGVKCKKSFFSQVSVSYILKNPAYYGNYIVNRHEYDGNRRTGKMKPGDEHITIEIPALISKTEWDKIQAKRAFNTQKSKRISQARDHWLRDLLVCEECGGPVKPYTVGRVRKDGTTPRYYACLYHKVTAKRLENYNRGRCWLPTIKAEEIEGMIWDDIVNTLTYGGFDYGGVHYPSRMEELIGTAKYDEQIARLEAVLQHQESELKGKERAKGRIMGLLEHDDYDQEDFRQKLAQVNEEIITITAAMSDDQTKIEALREAKANNEAFVEFARSNQSWLAGLREDLNNLAPDDKKLLVESLVPGKIMVWRAVLEDFESGPEWGLGNFPFSFNSAIFERLASEGKLKGLDKNDPNHPGAPRPHPLEQRQNFSRHCGHSPRRSGQAGGLVGRGVAEG